MYAPNDPIKRAELWIWMKNLPNIPWVIGGDFNMIESPLDKVGGRPFSWNKDEFDSWNNMIHERKLFDPIKNNANIQPYIRYTWCNL